MIGQTLLHYRIVEKIGEGGMGVVYKAVDTHLDRPVAIKILPPDKVADPERKRRFVLEAKAASALHHPNIVVIHDIASDRGVDFIVMEYVDGLSLDHLIGRRGMKLGPALGYAVQIADGLAKAHAAGIVHRDLKPTNVMVTNAGGLIKILDFGLAKLADAPPAAAGPQTMTLAQAEKPRTEEGFAVGTAAYMSPEQAEGGAVDARSDIFSFGVLLYEMLTGQKAFQRESRMKTLAAVLNDDPRPASDFNEAVPVEAERLLARCLRKDPQRRWQTISDLKVALQDMKEDSESGKLPAAGRPMRANRRPAALALGIAGAVLALAAAVVLLRLFVFKPGKKAAEFETTRLTFDAGVTMTPALSPDGKMVAYASDRESDGTLDLWVQQVSGGKPLRLTNSPGNDWFPDFSPDGTKIVFRSERDGGGIYIIDTLGTGDARRIADAGTAPRFSPDGSQIAYVVVPASLESRLFDLYLVPAKGGVPRPFHPEFKIGYVSQGATPVWAPDGKALLFDGALDADPASADWWVFPIDGREPVRTRAVANLALSPAVRYPSVWLGTDVYYVSGTTIEGVNVFRASIDPKSWQITGPAVAVTGGPGMKIMLSAARDGRFVYANIIAAIDAWSVAARPDEAFVSTDFRKITQDMMQKFNPSLTRDGTKLAFTAFGGLQGGRLEVRRRDLSNGRETILPTQGQNITFGQNPRLSPDGSVLAYRDSIAGKWRTFVLLVGSTSGTDVGEIGRVLDFFSDPNFALVQSKSTELAKRNLKTGESVPILVLAGGGFLNDGSLSPDNKWIAYRTGLPDGRAAISVVPAGAGAASAKDVVPIIQSDHFLGNPRWSPNGRYVYYLSERSGRCGLYAQKVDPQAKKPAGDAQAVFFTRGERINLNYPKGNAFIDVAADKIVFTVDEITGNIFMVTPVAR
jgi:Tol biopolymer transport system component/predicted Ser/Thr protein kinase